MLTLEEWAKNNVDAEAIQKEIANAYAGDLFRMVYGFGPPPIVPWYSRWYWRIAVPIGNGLIRLGRALGGYVE